MTTKQPYENPASQRERRRATANDRRVAGATYHGFATAEANTAGGRFAAELKTTVTAAGPIGYPTQPPNSPWASDPVGIEAPLGYSVDEPPVVGEVFEIQKSMCEATNDSGVRPSPGAVESPPSGDGSVRESHLPNATPSPPLRQKRKRR